MPPKVAAMPKVAAKKAAAAMPKVALDVIALQKRMVRDANWVITGG